MAWGSILYGESHAPGWVTHAKAIATRNNHGLAVLTDGSLITLGLLIGTSRQRTVRGSSGVVAVGRYHSVVLNADGSVVVWGAGGRLP